ncbi:hypothetical protein EC80586_4556, partial [Escherichia coli 8.0586]
MPDATHP